MENHVAGAQANQAEPRSSTAFAAIIDDIDQLIDANRRAVMHRLHASPYSSAHTWQNAWDRCPDLRARDNELSCWRGLVQLHRDDAEHREWQSQQRRSRAR